MARMFKTSVNQGTILWVGKVERPLMRHYGKPDNEEVYYIIKMDNPLSRTTGCSFNDDAPVPFLQSMGIKVEPRDARYGAKWKAIGCRYEEVRATYFQEETHRVAQDILSYYGQVKTFTNVQLEVLMDPFDEPAWSLGTIREGIGTLEPVPEEEGWIAI